MGFVNLILRVLVKQQVLYRLHTFQWATDCFWWRLVLRSVLLAALVLVIIIDTFCVWTYKRLYCMSLGTLQLFLLGVSIAGNDIWLVVFVTLIQHVRFFVWLIVALVSWDNLLRRFWHWTNQVRRWYYQLAVVIPQCCQLIGGDLLLGRFDQGGIRVKLLQNLLSLTQKGLIFYRQRFDIARLVRATVRFWCVRVGFFTAWAWLEITWLLISIWLWLPLLREKIIAASVLQR